MTRWPPYVLVWILFVFAWVSNYLIRMGLAALLPPIIAELDLSYTHAGVLASAFFTSYTVMQIPAGLLGDRYGRRRILLIGLVAGALASASTGLAVSFATLLGARLFVGAAQGCLFSNDRSIISAVTPREKLALGQAVSFTGPGLGLTLGLLLGGILGEWLPWRMVFVLFAFPALAAALLIGRLVPAPPPLPAERPLSARLAEVLRHTDLWLLGTSGATVMWVQYVLATWAPLLFLEAGVSELGRAGLYASLQGLAGVGGLLAGGWLADYADQHGLGRKAVLAASLTAVTAAMAVLAGLLAWRVSVVGLAVGLFLTAFCAWGVWGPAFALLGEVFHGRDLSTAFGLFNTLCVLGAMVGPAVTGWARDLTGSFAAAGFLSAAVALAGAVVTLLIRPAFRLGGRGRPRAL